MTRNSILIAVLFLGAGLAFHAGADVNHNQLAQNEAKPAAAASAEWTAGEVRKIDTAAGTVTIKHGSIPKLDMPPMIMAYHVKDKAMLGHLKAGDKIKFDVDRVDGKYTVTGLEKVK
jgi:Cu(I)/Ag(I) efflux system periplasmic protein CusF